MDDAFLEKSVDFSFEKKTEIANAIPKNCINLIELSCTHENIQKIKIQEKTYNFNWSKSSDPHFWEKPM